MKAARADLGAREAELQRRATDAAEAAADCRVRCCFLSCACVTCGLCCAWRDADDAWMCIAALVANVLTPTTNFSQGP